MKAPGAKDPFSSFGSNTWLKRKPETRKNVSTEKSTPWMNIARRLGRFPKHNIIHANEERPGRYIRRGSTWFASVKCR